MLLYIYIYIYIYIYKSHNKLGSQIGSFVVRTIIKNNERNKIYNSCSLQSKTNNCDKNDIIYITVLSVDL